MFVDRVCIVSDSYFFGTQLVCQLPADDESVIEHCDGVVRNPGAIFGSLIRSPDLLPGDVKLYAT